jgi:uncharacterized protein YciI
VNVRRLSGIAALLLAVSIGPAGAQTPKPPAGMDTYLFGILRSGDVPPPPTAEAQAMQLEHRKNMGRMADAGLMVGAGPLLGGGEYRGIFIFKGDARDKINELVKGDPLIQSGRLVLELLPWWGPEKIGERYFAARKENPAAKDTMVEYQLAFLLAGPNRKGDSDPETQKIQEAHMAHIRKMADTGQLVAAGPFLEENKLRGVFVFKLPTLDEAKTVAAQDPAGQAGRLVLDVHPWLVADGVLPPPKTAAVGKQ